MPTKDGRTNIVLDDETRRMVKAIQDRYGFLPASQAIRFAIRELYQSIRRPESEGAAGRSEPAPNQVDSLS